MEIRKLERGDAAAFQRAYVRALNDHPGAFGTSLHEQLKLTQEQVADMITPIPQRFTMGAFDGVALVAFTCFYQAPRQKMCHRGHIWGLYVAPEARGNGLGRALLAGITEHARQLDGLEEIVLAATVGNAPARRVYMEAGFVPYCIEERLLKVGEHYFDVEWMRLRL
jgi:ribosomal protein S18 acetylase RimI-like enzyme